jgi:hypothetical protein
MKSIFQSLSLKKQQPAPDEPISESVSFVVVDDEAKVQASKILSKVKIPVTPSLHALGEAYIFGNWLRRKIEKNDIHIIEKKNLTKEEAYQQNVNIFQNLIAQRDALLGVVEHMVEPLIKNVAAVNIQQRRDNDRIILLERQVIELQAMIKSVYGKSPTIPKLPNGKMPWSRSIKDAANEIIKNYETDCKEEVRSFRSLRDASDEFFDGHVFTYKQDYSKEQLYENVKRANSPWLGKKG